MIQIYLTQIATAVAIDQAGRQVSTLYGLDYQGGVWTLADGEWQYIGHPTVEKHPATTAQN